MGAVKLVFATRTVNLKLGMPPGELARKGFWGFRGSIVLVFASYYYSIL